MIYKPSHIMKSSSISWPCSSGVFPLPLTLQFCLSQKHPYDFSTLQLCLCLKEVFLNIHCWSIFHLIPLLPHSESLLHTLQYGFHLHHSIKATLDSMKFKNNTNLNYTLLKPLVHLLLNSSAQSLAQLGSQ